MGSPLASRSGPLAAHWIMNAPEMARALPSKGGIWICWNACITHSPTGVPTKSWFWCVTRSTRPHDAMVTLTRPLPRVGPAEPQADAFTAAVSSCWVAAARSKGRAGGGTMAGAGDALAGAG